MNKMEAERFIPTYVGHTFCRDRLCPLCTVHPHLRGAYTMADRVAYVTAVHPHLRGAYNGSRTQRANSYGSSPPTWGILLRHGFAHLYYRFIPTYVGHTYTSASRSAAARGSSPPTWGIRCPGRRRCSPLGSSPPTWGIRHGEAGPHRQHLVHPHLRGAYAYRLHMDHLKLRFIPTYVGHTEVVDVQIRTINGSSPPTWGIPYHLPCG